MLDLPEKIIIFDTEFTAWAGSEEHNWSRPNEYREIVQIGAISVDTKQFVEIDHINLFIKPVKNQILSEYFSNLTGISQKDIDKNGISYKEAILKFSSWCGHYSIYSFGGDEENIEENCEFAGIRFPFNKSRFHDIKDIFRNYGISVDQYDSGNIVEAFGKKAIFRNHNALNDVRILLDGLRELSIRIQA